MKKKLLIALLAITAAVCGAFGFSACGDDGKNGIDGNNGADGSNGKDGLSAYQIWLNNGHTGSETDFLTWLQGKDGDDGDDGKDGSSAYQVWLNNGHTGSETDFLTWLQGKDGDDAVSITEATIDDDGNLIVTLTNGKTINCGKVKEPEPVEELQYMAIKENNEVVSYCVQGLGDVTDCDVVIPSAFRGKPVTEIADYAFQNNNKLISVTIPDSIETIGKDAFLSCNSLNKVNIHDVAKWCAVSFGNANSNPLYLAHNLYIDNELATEVTIPEEVKSISDCAFNQCNSLTSIIIPEGVTSIGINAFNKCENLTNISIPDSLISIGNMALSGCDNLQYNIYDNAFYLGNATNPYVLLLLRKKNSITSCNVNDKTKFIYGNAFHYCSQLTTISIPASVTVIGDRAFENCNRIKEVHISDLAKWCAISFGAGNSNPFSYGGANLYLNDEIVTDLKIPDGVTSIKNSVFFNCRNLISVTIPSSVTFIGNSAFYSLNKLTSIIIPDGVTTIDRNAFSSCTNLKSVTIPKSVTVINSYAFGSCISLKEVHISDITKWCAISFEDESSNPLYYAHNLYVNDEPVTDLVIPDNVTSIGKFAFCGCNGLISLTIPNTVTEIGISAFNNCNFESITAPALALNSISCSKLKTVIITSGDKIPDAAFKNSTLLTSVTIAGNVTSIGEEAFSGCSALNEITFKGKMEQWLAIKKGELWYSSENYTIHCTDGDIVK